MQIYEISQQLNEGPLGRNVASAVMNPITAARVAAGGGSGAPGTSLSSRIAATKLEKKVQDISDRTLNAWKNYIYQVEKGIDPQDLSAFQNRSDGRYRKELLSWIQTNLLRGLYLPNSQNFGQINNIINQLSGTQTQQPQQQPQQPQQPQEPKVEQSAPGAPSVPSATHRCRAASQHPSNIKRKPGRPKKPTLTPEQSDMEK